MEFAKVIVMAHLMFPFGLKLVLRYLTNYSGCFCESVLWLRLAFRSMQFE